MPKIYIPQLFVMIHKYISYSNGPYRRLKEHNTSSSSTYTSKHQPWILKAIYECSESKAVAIEIKRFIKR